MAATAVAAASAGVLVLSACGGYSSPAFSTGADDGNVSAPDPVVIIKAADRRAGPKLDGTTVDGEKLDVGDAFTGKGKVVVINVWGSWCTPCRAEIPHFVKVAKETRGMGVEFVGINTQDRSRAPAAAFEREHGVSYPSLYDPAGKLLLRFPKGTMNPQLIPATVVLDQKGRIAARAQARVDAKTLRRMIDPLISSGRSLPR